MKKRIVSSVIAVCTMLSLQISASAANIGVCTHMTASHTGETPQRIAELVEEIGSDWVRDELRWDWGMETIKGELKMPSSDWTGRIDDMGVNSLVILGYGNNIYNREGIEDEGETYVPTIEHTDYFEAYKNYVRFVATKCKGKVDAYEVWNEPNHAPFNYQLSKDKYSYTASDYAELLIATKEVLDVVDPEAKVVGGSFLIGGTVNSGWMEELFTTLDERGGDEGANKFMDGFSYHVYSYAYENKEEAMRSSFDRVEKIMDDYGFTGEAWLTETGYYSGTDENSVSEKEQASLVIRSKLAWDDYLKDNNREGNFFWYVLRSTGREEATAGHNFGLTTYGYSPKEGFYSAKAYNELLRDMDFVSMTTSADENDYIALYEGGAADRTDKVYVAYKKRNYSSPVEVPVSGDAAYVYDYQGSLIDKYDTSGGTISLTFTDTSPVFVHCVDYTTEIESIEYDDQKNFCTISGKAEYFDSVSIELISGDNVVQTETVKVDDDGSFTKAFQPNSDGDYLVRVGMPEAEALGGTRWAEQEFAMYRDGLSQATVGITCLTEAETDGLRVNLSGSVDSGEAGQRLNLLLVPEGSSDIKEAAYAGDVITDENGAFEVSFKIPQSVPHTYHYTLYVRGAETELKQDAVDYIIGNGEILAYDFSLELSGNVFTASAYVKNTTDSVKKPVILIAQYDENGILIDIAKQETDADYTKKFLSVSAAKKAQAKKCRAYIWDGMGQMNPIAPDIYKKVN